MEQKAEIMYIRAAYGNTAVKQPVKKITLPPLPKIDLNKPRRIYVDPVAFLGCIVAAVMLVLLVFGMFHLSEVREEYETWSTILTELKREYADQSHRYHTTVDVDEARKSAEKAGFIPVEEAERFTVVFSVPESRKEMTWWEDTMWLLSGLFDQPRRG